MRNFVSLAAVAALIVVAMLNGVDVGGYWP